MKKSICIIILIILLINSTIIFAANVPVTGIQVQNNNITIEIGQTATIVTTILPDNATNKNVTWTSSNTRIATVTPKGEIKGISAGVTTMRGVTADGGYTVNVTVRVSGTSTITSEKYSIMKKPNSLNEEINYITKIAEETSISDFKKNITTYANMEFYDLGNKQMGDLDYVFSGTRVRLSDNSEYTLVVTGDVNSDGKISVVDLSRLKLRIIGVTTLDDYQTEGADVNYDGKLSITDLSNLKMYLVGLKENF